MSAPTPPPVPPAPPLPPTGSSDASTLPYGTAPLESAPGDAGQVPSTYVPAYGSGYGTAPAPWTPPVTAPQNVLAWVAFGLGLGSLMFGPISSIAAIVCGHIARAQIRRTGEQGAGAALTGLIFGYVLTIGMVVAIVLYVLLVVAIVAGTAYSSGVPTSL
ncbi:DUF4190 domain-containing protein [Agromyces sp. SYSU T00266]|uniref:DUF4190 domain-containing protein n=1 Tax=Agromyces zhanjiangensis TaxID=3158562 RepID=UPI003391A338